MNASFRYLFCFLVLTPFTLLFSQIDQLHGDYAARANNTHSGNRIRTTFFNDGDWGRKNDATEYGLDWPKNNIEKARYWSGSANVVGSEVLDANKQKIHIFSESDIGNHEMNIGDRSPHGDWWTFLPLPGFHNPLAQRVAMSQEPETWPGFWPDKDQAEDVGWVGQWNGYFGKNRFNADQESYFVYDDYNNQEFNFFPDSTDSTRGGLGLRVTARGLQWSNVQVEDILFTLFDIKNIGTYNHNRIVFGNKSALTIGVSTQGGDDYGDDIGKYLLDQDLAISYDLDDMGAPGGWNPVGRLGIAYLETPGYPYDGIDNDADGNMNGGAAVSEMMFEANIIQAGESLVFINYDTFERTVAGAFTENLNDPFYTMDEDSIKLFFLKQEFSYVPGDTLVEIPFDNFDNNLNGIIDENNGSTFGKDPLNQITRYIYVGNKYIDYVSGSGKDNPMIDEKRDDGIDNNGNWSLLDDVGLDGNKNTLDAGQGDGMPTSGWVNGIDTGLPGEPHIDKTDIHESDMIGLTSFELTKPFSSLPQWDDELLWEHMAPGYLDDEQLLQDDTDMAFGSGYFAMAPGQIERYSMSYQMAYTEEDLIRNKEMAENTYAENYQFATAPYTPTLTAVPGDGKVTLYWDDVAESSVDPIEGMDFEGYRIYRSTDALWSDMEVVTNPYGNRVFYVPLALYDVVNEYSGFTPVPTLGAMFDMGSNSGLQHSWVDTTVTNGIRYYYAITSYDHGSPGFNIPPTECPIILDLNAIGVPEKVGRNVQIVTPGVNVAGVEPPPEGAFAVDKVSGMGNGSAYYTVIDPRLVKNENSYRITFVDTTFIDTTKRILFTSITQKYSVFNLTTNEHVITTDFVPSPTVVDGLQLYFQTEPEFIPNLSSAWSRSEIIPYEFRLHQDDYGILSKPILADFKVLFGDVGLDTSTAFQINADEFWDSVPVNFTIINLATGDKVPFAFYESDKRLLGEGAFTVRYKNRSDEIVLLTKDASGNLAKSWSLTYNLNVNNPAETLMPTLGDSLHLLFDKPFSVSDTLIYTSPPAQKYDAALAQESLEKINVVPNPYIVTNEFEPVNYYDQGRGDRAIHFTNLPMKCTIRIYTISGQLVDTIEHESAMTDRGEIAWDMTTKEEMDIGFGVYVYHVDAGDLGTKIGKFAVIK
jgi:hypothetical protein